MKLSLVLASLLAFPLLANVPSAKIRAKLNLFASFTSISSQAAVIKAIQDGDVKAVATYIDKYDLDLNILLLYATAEGSFKTVDYLIKNGADVNCSDECDVSPLDIVPYNKIEIGTLLKQSGATTSVNKRGLDADLLAAAEEGAIEKVLRLIKLGANIEAQDNKGQTALMLAVQWEHTEIVILLLKHKANIEAKDNSSRSPLHYATQQNNRQILELLLTEGADPKLKDTDGNTPFNLAVINEQPALAAILLKAMVGINGRDDKSWSP